MGMFDTVSSAVTSAEGVANKANSPLDTANQLLSGGPAAAAPGASKDADVPYKHGKDIDEDVKEKADAYAHNLENALNSIHSIEFIHFDYVHISNTDFFVHDNDYSDLQKNDDLKDGERPRAIQFRSGLEREAILLSEFMKATQRMLTERESTGSLNVASVVNTLGNLFGSSTAPSKTKASDLDDHIGKVVAAVKPALDDLIEYKNTHQAGMDLHQARANYRALLQKIVDEKPDADPTGGLMAKLPGIGGSAGSFGKIISFSQGVATKAQDVKAKFFALAALQQEPQVEIACNEMTLKAIADTANPFLPVWYRNRPKNEKQATWDNAPANPLSSGGNVGNTLMDPVVKKVGEGRDDVVKAGNEVKAFFEKPSEDPPPGKDALGTAFTNPPEPDDDDSKKTLVPMEMGKVAFLAFAKSLKIDPPLGFPETVIGDMVGIVLEFTGAVYQSLLERDATKPIEQAALLKSAREDLKLVDRLKDLALSKLTALKKLKEDETPDIPYLTGFNVRPGDLIDKEADKLDDLIEEKIAPVIDPILSYAMDSLGDELEKARLAGQANNCDTMEWYLGRLPSIQVGLFCHLFFPFWNALMKTIADLLDSATGGILKKIVDTAASLQKDVAIAQAGLAAAHQTAEDAKAKLAATDKAITDTQKDFAQSGPIQGVPGKVGSMFDRFNNAAGATGAKGSDPKKDAANDAKGPAAANPLDGRSEKGKGKKIGKDEYNTVKANHQWLDPNGPDIKKDDPPASDDG